MDSDGDKSDAESGQDEATCQTEAKETVEHENDNNTADVSKKSTKLFVGGLARETKEADVREYFSKLGNVVECIVGTTKSGGSKGYGFIRMSTVEEAEALLDPAEPHTLQGRVIIVKKHVARTANMTERKLRLVVTNLDREKTTEETMRAHFSKFGTVTECCVSMDNVDGKTVSRGLGFVTMSNLEEVEAILSSNVNDAQIVDGASATVKPVLSNKYKQYQIYVGNLQTGVTTTKALREHFDQFGTVMELSHGRKVRNSETVQRGFAYIRMSSQEEYDAVVRAHDGDHNHRVEGRLLDVRTQDTRQDHDKFRKLWFGGLDKEKTTEADLTEHFSSFGTVQDCIIIRNPPDAAGEECKSKGYGFVVMANIGQTKAILKQREPHTIHDKALVFNRALHVTANQWTGSLDNNLKRHLTDLGHGSPHFKKMKGRSFTPGVLGQARVGDFGGGFGSPSQQSAETYYEDSPSGYVPVKVFQSTGPGGLPTFRGIRTDGAWPEEGYYDEQWMDRSNSGRQWNGQRGGHRGGGSRGGGNRGGQRGKHRGKGRPY